MEVLESWKDLGRLWETNISHSGIGSNSITPFNRIQRLEITVNQQLHAQIWSLCSSFTFVTVAIKWEIFYPNWIVFCPLKQQTQQNQTDINLDSKNLFSSKNVSIV